MQEKLQQNGMGDAVLPSYPRGIIMSRSQSRAMFAPARQESILFQRFLLGVSASHRVRYLKNAPVHLAFDVFIDGLAQTIVF